MFWHWACCDTGTGTSLIEVDDGCGRPFTGVACSIMPECYELVVAGIGGTGTDTDCTNFNGTFIRILI